jgi:sarcosine/dimethylglycine N-methyltransferase
MACSGLSSGKLQYTQLLPYDQHHYYGTQAIDDLVRELGISEASRVINVGSGLGGPARYLAGRYGCQVLACELQDDLHRTASELTARCDLSGRVHHVAGDFLQISQHLATGGYDFIVSWLTVLHIADRAELFKNCYSLLRPGGVFFAADFFQNGRLTHEEWRTLRDDVGCPSMVGSLDAYSNELELAGFKVIKVEDMTSNWRGYTKDRSLQFATDHEALSDVLGEDVYLNLKRFYDIVAALYNGGNLGGLHVYAQKPRGW